MKYVLRPTLFILAILLTACNSPQSETTEPDAPAADSTALAYDWISLSYVDLVVGDGAVIAAGQTAVMHYTGWLWDESMPEGKGEKFDSSRDRDQPFVTQIGVGRVIQGWDKGVPGMRIGGRRMLLIPYQMGYGEAGRGSIPPRATMLFDVELLEIQ